MVKPVKIGIGAGLILLGLYIINSFIKEIGAVIAGIFLISVGIGIIASK